MSHVLVLVEFDIFNGEDIVTIRVSSHGFTDVVGGRRFQTHPSLRIPLPLGERIAAEQYGQAVSSTPSSGEIEFHLMETMLPILNWYWIGRKCRIFKGLQGQDFAEFLLVYTGRVSELNFDAMSSFLSVSVTDASFDLDKLLVEELYDDEALLALRGRPRPYARGTVYSIAPNLIDDVDLVYELSYGRGLSEVIEVRVGGVPWDWVSGVPGGGQWSVDLDAGTIRLGSATLGGEVRCDAKIIGWEDLTSGGLIREIVEESNGLVNEGSFSRFELSSPGLIGFYSIEPINRKDVLNTIVFGAGAWWEFMPNGYMRVGVLEEPGTNSMLELNRINIQSLSLSGIVLPAWRIKVEYKRNWQPLSNAFSGALNQEDQKADGIVAEVFEDESVKILEPLAVEAPLIRSLFVSENDAIVVGNRLGVAWGKSRKLYEVTFRSDFAHPNLYNIVRLDFKSIKGYFRIHSIVYSVGEEVMTMQLWGSNDVEYYLLNNYGELVLDGSGNLISTPSSQPPIQEGQESLTFEGEVLTLEGDPLTVDIP